MKARVSVVIAAYNAAEFIERSVRSALEQSYPVWEIIVVDDGSTDGTAAAVRRLAEHEPTIKLIQSETNAGPANARNKGFAAATGAWIAVLDADDAFLPERVSGLMEISEGADIVADNFLLYDRRRDEVRSSRAVRLEGWDTIDMLMFADARREHEDFGLFQPIFRRAFLDRHRLRYPENCRHGEDFLFVAEALALGGVYRLLWKPGYLYTTRDSGWSRTLVDYAGVGRAVGEFADRKDLDLSPAVRAKLVDRVAYTRELHIRHSLVSAIRQRRPLQVLRLALRHRAARRTIAQAAVRKLARPFALPRAERES